MSQGFNRAKLLALASHEHLFSNLFFIFCVCFRCGQPAQHFDLLFCLHFPPSNSISQDFARKSGCALDDAVCHCRESVNCHMRGRCSTGTCKRQQRFDALQKLRVAAFSQIFEAPPAGVGKARSRQCFRRAVIRPVRAHAAKCHVQAAAAGKQGERESAHEGGNVGVRGHDLQFLHALFHLVLLGGFVLLRLGPQLRRREGDGLAEQAEQVRAGRQP